MKTSPQNVKGHIEQNRRIFIVVIKENKLALCSYPTEFRLFNAMVTFVIEIPFQLSKAVFFFFPICFKVCLMMMQKFSKTAKGES